MLLIYLLMSGCCFRLRATGVVNVENPVKKALHEGRLEEIEDVD